VTYNKVFLGFLNTSVWCSLSCTRVASLPVLLTGKSTAQQGEAKAMKPIPSRVGRAPEETAELCGIFNFSHLHS
jgi:hypothetical protein